MDRAGERLKRVRERLKLTYRDVEEASQAIAKRLNNSEYAIALSRLADIENKGTLPSIYRIYSLCAIYRLNYDDVLQWYRVPAGELRTEWMRLQLRATHEIPSGTAEIQVPESLEFAMDPDKTTFLNYVIGSWGAAPIDMLKGLDLRRFRYGMIGLGDRSMSPILNPGAVVVIDQRAKIRSDGWTSEFDRPVYFLESREGFLCGWCDLCQDRLIVLPHPSSCQRPKVFRYPDEIDLIGQVTGVAMSLGSAVDQFRADAAKTR